MGEWKGRKKFTEVKNDRAPTGVGLRKTEPWQLHCLGVFNLVFGALLGQTLQVPGDSFLIGGSFSPLYSEPAFTFPGLSVLSVLLPNICFLLTLTAPMWLPARTA
jgi:hypothetical protein